MLITITAPSDLPITLDEAKAHLRVDYDDENTGIEAYLLAAVEYVQNSTTLILSPASLQYRLDEWPLPSAAECWRHHHQRSVSRLFSFDLPCKPVRDVTSITYVDVNGDEQTLDASEWSWEVTDVGAAITFGGTFSAPYLASDRKGVVRVNFEAGFDLPGQSGSGDDPNLKLPKLARAGALLVLGHWYQNREAVVNAVQPYVMPISVEAIIAQLKVYR